MTGAVNVIVGHTQAMVTGQAITGGRDIAPPPLLLQISHSASTAQEKAEGQELSARSVERMSMDLEEIEYHL